MEYVTHEPAEISLQNTRVTLLDSIYNPFGAATDERSFLNLQKFSPYPRNVITGKKNELIFEFKLSGNTKYQQRVRYGVWQALGDIGGFYDGLGLIFSSIISQFAATRFLIDLFTGLHVDEHTLTTKEKKKRKQLIKAIKSSEPGAFANQNNFGTLLDTLRNLKSLKISLKESTANFCCRLLRKNKGHRLIQRLQDYSNK